MSALSDFPAKENKTHGGGVQNYPQSHEPAPPSTAVSNSGVFSHWCFIKTPGRHCLKTTLLTPPSWRTGEKKRTRTEDITKKWKFLFPRRLYLEWSWPLESPTFHCLCILHTACVMVTTFTKLLIPEKHCEVFSSIWIKLPLQVVVTGQFEPTWGCCGAFSFLLCFQCHKYLIAVVNI